MPLLYEPGEGWQYSVSIDWAGKMVERVNGGIRLGEYMKKNIWDPLGMTSTGFRPKENENILKNWCPTTRRTPEGELVPSPPYQNQNPKDDLGGGGLYSSAPDYIKVLISLLKNDGKLLKPETVKSMFTPQLPDDKYIVSTVTAPVTGAMYRGGIDSAAWNWGLGGILNMEDVQGICKKGTLSWGGLPNLFWVRRISLQNFRTGLTDTTSGLIQPQVNVACIPLRFSHQAMPSRLPSRLYTGERSLRKSHDDVNFARQTETLRAQWAWMMAWSTRRNPSALTNLSLDLPSYLLSSIDLSCRNKVHRIRRPQASFYEPYSYDCKVYIRHVKNCE